MNELPTSSGLDDLVQAYPSATLRDAALDRIKQHEDDSDVKSKDAARMRALVDHSSYGAIYSQFVLDPSVREQLMHNQQFITDAVGYGINVSAWCNAQDSDPLRLELGQKGVIVEQKLLDQLDKSFTLLDEVTGQFRSEEFYQSLENYASEDDSEVSLGFSGGSEKRDYYFMSYLDEVVPQADDTLKEKITQELILQGVLSETGAYLPEDKLPEAARYIGETLEAHIAQPIDTLVSEGLLRELYSSWRETGNVVIPGQFGEQKTGHDFMSALISLVNDAPDLIERYDVGLFVNHDYYLQEFLTLGSHLIDLQENDITAPIFTEIGKSSRLKNVAEVEYFCRVEALLPTDVSAGNDGGCCIAVNPSSSGQTEEQGNAPLMGGDFFPFYQLDLATVIVGVYQRAVKSRAQKPLQRQAKRVGMALVHASIDLDGVPVQAINSLELSQQMNPLSREGLQSLTGYVIRCIDAVGTQAGFQGLAMGTHNYNTARNFIPGGVEMIQPDYKKEELLKLPDHVPDGKQVWYSEIYEPTGTSNQEWAWLRKPGSDLVLEGVEFKK